ncbi:MFS transporter [Reticulibacter mediterranei]|uniref:MFS transporter n=1 Tax=Reticulibacter mediterranei TaxID=2778369 RepID=A0A8J3IIU3_9CHLR|nr:MFS transporter [Reticulibacter mediterranei]GHO92194.1 MFS transporter [Reticulibacter mediterranei]
MKTVSVANKHPDKIGERVISWQWAVAVLVSMAVFLDTVDVSIINVALPHLQQDLKLTTTDLQWVQGAYVLTNAGLQLLGGRAADLFGRRRIFLIGTCLFGLASLICGLAYSGWLLILARGIQGIGAALMFPSAVSILTTTFDEGPERNKALGIFTAVAGAGFSLGLVVGGLLTSFIGWHWVFFVNVPIVVIIVVLSLLLVPESRSASSRQSYDLAGAVTVTAGLLLLVYAITQASNEGATLLKTAVLFFVALVLLTVFILIELRSRAPLMPLHIFRSSALRSANVGFLTLLGSFFGFLFIFTLYLQDVLHYSPIQASLALLPGSLVSILASRYAAPWLLNRVGMKLSCCLGLLCMMSGIALFVQIGASSDYIGVILPTVILTQVGMSIGNTAFSLAGVRGVEATEQGLAAGLQGAVGAAGGGLGLAIVSTVVAAVTATSLHTTNAGPVVAAQLGGLHAGLLTAAVGAAFGVLIALIGIRK